MIKKLLSKEVSSSFFLVFLFLIVSCFSPELINELGRYFLNLIYPGSIYFVTNLYDIYFGLCLCVLLTIERIVIFVICEIHIKKVIDLRQLIFLALHLLMNYLLMPCLPVIAIIINDMLKIGNDPKFYGGLYIVTALVSGIFYSSMFLPVTQMLSVYELGKKK